MAGDHRRTGFALPSKALRARETSEARALSGFSNGMDHGVAGAMRKHAVTRRR